jgi:Protein of unknown function (DUF3106)
MPRPNATRPNSLARKCIGAGRSRVSVERSLTLPAILLLSISPAAIPVVYAQHGNPGGNSHPAPPRQSAPPAQAPRPTYRGPAPEAGPAYRAAPPGNAPRPGASYPAVRGPYSVPPANTRGSHLGNWLNSHQGESFAGQENALRREPGFNSLPQQQQRRLIDRLHQLDTMPPQQRQRTLGRIENMERLSPDRRQAVRSSAQELSNMDPARKQQVRGAFRVLREMPPGEREQVLNSPAYRSMYSDHERQVLGNLLSVEPYTPR